MSNLPVVTEDTIKEIGQEMLDDKQRLFNEMAAANPELFRFIYDVHALEETNKGTMFGLIIAVYHTLERQIEIGKRGRKRLRHNAD